MDRSHPLTEGLSLRGVIWGAGKGAALDGAPVIMAGGVPLVADTELAVPGGGSRHEVRIRVDWLLSTLLDSPDWPILIANVHRDRPVSAQIADILIDEGERRVGRPFGKHLALTRFVSRRQIEIEWRLARIGRPCGRGPGPHRRH